MLVFPCICCRLVTAAVIEARLAGTAWEAEMNSIKARVRQKLDLARLLR